MQTKVLRAAVPALLIACVAIECWRGGDALPTWIANLSLKTGVGPDRALRIVLALQLAGAIVALAWERFVRPVCWAAGTAMAFSGLAELSAIVNAPGTAAVARSTWLAPLAGLAVGAGILWALTRPAPPDGAAPARVGSWTVLGVLGVLTLSLVVAARLPLSERTRGSTGADGVETVVLNPEEWVGMSAAEAGIARHVPQLTPLTMEGTKWVVFYSPRCGRCHDVMKVYFAGDNRREVIAVEIPTAPGDVLAETDQPATVECENCERLALPSGKRWVITPPTIVRFEDGKVACATSSDYTRCRHDPASTP